jgi:spermidine synthase
VVEGDSVTLFLDDLPSSQFYLSNPAELEFEYMRWCLAAIRVTFPPEARINALHLGGGACALARALAHLWPASRHLAIEIDPKLAAAVRRHLPLPAKPVLRIRVADAAETLPSRPAASHDLIIRDIFDPSGSTPAQFASSKTAAQVARVLKPDGLYLVNRGEEPPLSGAKEEARLLGQHFADVAVITEPGLLRGRRRGNVVLAARHRPFNNADKAILRRHLAADGFPARLLDYEETASWAA